ncbi:hypothetical protein [Caulobacter sp. 1776]|uniref:hypothetical protein n=1 Tax=Caulobacter sp. 1776 TaxID=3156420 RepID=UPI0033931EAC
MPQNLKINVANGNQPAERQMFQTGFSFHEGAIRCAEPVIDPQGITVSPNSPMIACYAMAAELYLKALMVLDTGSAIQGHRLNVLFAKLKQATIKSVENRFVKFSGEGAGELQRILPQISAAFVEWRYIFEDKGGRNIPVASLVFFAQALFAEIRERRPDWTVTEYLEGRLLAVPKQIITTVVSGGGGAMVRHVVDGATFRKA